ncbi:hypothetical protein [Xiamenia xianingshaonis]|uniref:Uncharacterized protein n=1 Tax=Xiamenia xianingshaonis TaxID=2682776 RepID=A0A9E6MS22_9ACTN|nr:hypothetical protein [Xiamenia xianingshaonis]NHM14430.1 hypothetical protein [Xiamenia xianingshaonis]QTU84904.1 hypothetical protein J7S26_03060 [Xiamenia xianingshaonis]
MENISLQTMETWLKSAMEAERRIIVTDAALTDLKSAIKTAGKHKYPKAPENSKYDLKPKTLRLTLLGVALVLALLGFYGFDLWVNSTVSYSFFSFEHLAFLAWPFIDALLLLAVIVFAIMFIRQIIAVLRVPRENSKLKQAYEQEYAEYKRKVASIDQLNYNERKALPALEEQRDALASTLNKLVIVRQRIYAKGYLASDYCRLAPVATMYGYIKTGRCTQVYGHGGLVDTFENDRHFAVLNGKLDIIISELGSLRQTQQELARTLDRMGTETKRLRTDIGNFANQLHSDNEYLIECTRWNGESLNWISAVETTRLLWGK